MKIECLFEDDIEHGAQCICFQLSDAIMMQSNRKLSKPSGRSCLPSSRRYSFVIKGCAVFFLTSVFYLHYRFAYSILSGPDTLNTDGDVVSRNDMKFQSLQLFPVNKLTAESTVEEWEQETQNPMTGLYRYSSISTIQLPTADLEVEGPKFKHTQADASYQVRDPSNSNDIVILTRQGHKYNQEDRKRTPNQDRVLVLSRRDDSDWWMGLFDGHGYYGHLVSQYVSSEFARGINKEWEGENFQRSSKITSSKQKSIAVVNVLKDLCLEINKSMPGFMSYGGSTGISLLKRDDLLYISNVGDSVAFVASYDKTQNKIKIMYSTKPHKPDTPKERQRIEANGGRVVDPPFEGATARLVIPVQIGSQMMEYGLAMSRSFGDHEGEKVGLSVEPDTDVLDISQFDKNLDYVVVAVTDGLVDFDKLTEQEVAVAIAKALSAEEDRVNTDHPLVSALGNEAAKKLIMKSSRMWDAGPDNYRDDISIVAHKLRL